MERQDFSFTQDGAKIQQLLNAIQPPSQTSQPAGGMIPNIMYNFGVLSGDTTFLMAAPTDNTIVNHWYWTFDVEEISGELPTVTWPAGILAWNGGEAPEMVAHTHYEISVLNGFAAFMAVELPEEEEGE